MTGFRPAWSPITAAQGKVICELLRERPPLGFLPLGKKQRNLIFFLDLSRKTLPFLGGGLSWCWNIHLLFSLAVTTQDQKSFSFSGVYKNLMLCQPCYRPALMCLHSASLLPFNAPGDWTHPQHIPDCCVQSFFTITKQWKCREACRLLFASILDIMLVFISQSNWLLWVSVSSSSARTCSESCLTGTVLFWPPNLRSQPCTSSPHTPTHFHFLLLWITSLAASFSQTFFWCVCVFTQGKPRHCLLTGGSWGEQPCSSQIRVVDGPPFASQMVLVGTLHLPDSCFPTGKTKAASASLELLFVPFSADLPARKGWYVSADGLWAPALVWGSKELFQGEAAVLGMRIGWPMLQQNREAWCWITAPTPLLEKGNFHFFPYLG